MFSHFQGLLDKPIKGSERKERDKVRKLDYLFEDDWEIISELLHNRKIAPESPQREDLRRS